MREAGILPRDFCNRSQRGKNSLNNLTCSTAFRGKDAVAEHAEPGGAVRGLSYSMKKPANCKAEIVVKKQLPAQFLPHGLVRLEQIKRMAA
jgi:hypothetical protein